MKKSNLKRFQELLINENIDLYLVPTSDYHNSEYIGDYFKTREYLTNFTGSAGTLLISKDNAYLFLNTNDEYELYVNDQLIQTIEDIKHESFNTLPIFKTKDDIKSETN